MLEEDFEGAVVDACIIAARQRAEHYEIAAYGTCIPWAEALGLGDVAELLNETLAEEKAAGSCHRWRKPTSTARPLRAPKVMTTPRAPTKRRPRQSRLRGPAERRRERRARRQRSPRLLAVEGEEAYFPNAAAGRARDKRRTKAPKGAISRQGK